MCLEQVLPHRVAKTLNTLFDKRKTAAGSDIYYQCKKLLLKVHGPRPDADYKKAQSLVATGAPSQTAKELVQLICKKPTPLVECCCAIAVGSLWRELLPTIVKSAVANFDLADPKEFEQAMDVADNVWHSVQTPAGQVSAVKRAAADKAADKDALDESDLQVAAVGNRRNNPRGGGGRGRSGRRGGRGNSQNQETETPPEGCCEMHKKHGKKAFYCTNRKKCPWSKFENPPQED